jgi:hypothetical protein
MEANMSARTGRLLLAAGLALAPALGLAQDRAVPRGGGGDGGGSHSGGGDAGSRHTSPGVQSSGSSSSSSSGSSSTYSAPSNAERRHPRAGTGRGSSGGYYPGYPGYGYPGWGGGWYYPGYGGYWWPYGYYGWYGGGYGGYGSYWGGYPGGWGGGSVYYSGRGEGGSLRVLVDPAEARVYVDGYYAGVVDDFDGLLQRLHVSPGRHEITLKLEGYKTHRMRVYVGPDATLKLHHDLQKGVGETQEDLTGGAPLPEREVRRERDDSEDDAKSIGAEDARSELPAEFGKLQLSVQPEDASVYVDGAFRGSGREASSLRLAPGRHRIEVVRPGFRTAESEVEVPAGETTRLKVTLERPSI